MVTSNVPGTASTVETAPPAQVAVTNTPPASSIRDAWKAFQEKGDAPAPAGRDAEGKFKAAEPPADGEPGEAPAETEAAAEAPPPEPKRAAKDEILARIREGRKLAQEKLELAQTKREIEAAKAEIQLARDVRAAVEAKDYVRLMELTKGDFQELVQSYARHDRDLTTEERIEVLESERKAERERATKDSEERAQRERQGNYERAIASVQQLAEANTQEFKFIAAKGLAPNVIEYALMAHKEGRTMTVPEAAREFEANYRKLMQQQLAEARDLLGDEPSAATPGKPATRNDKPIPTISNRAAASAPASSDVEWRKQALAALKKL